MPNPGIEFDLRNYRDFENQWRNLDRSFDRIDGSLQRLEKLFQGLEQSLDSSNREMRQADRQTIDLTQSMRVMAKDGGRSIDITAHSIDKLGDEFAVSAVAAELAANIIYDAFYAIAGAVKAGFDAFVEWESQFQDVIKTIDIAPEKIGAFERELRSLATDPGNPISGLENSHETLARIAAQAGQLGIAADDIAMFTDVIAKLSIAAPSLGDEAAVDLARIINVTGLPIDQFDELAASIVNLGNNTATSEREILNFMTRLAAAGSLAGLTEQEIAGISAQMSAVGLNAEAGSTAMQMTLQTLSTMVATGGKEMDSFVRFSGVSAAEFADIWESEPVDALLLFLDTLGGLDQAGQVEFLEDMGLAGIRTTQTLQSLAANTEGFRDTLAVATADTNALNEEAAKRFATTEAQVSLFHNQLRELAITIGSVLNPVFREMLAIAQETVGGTIDLINDLGAITGLLPDVTEVSDQEQPLDYTVRPPETIQQSVQVQIDRGEIPWDVWESEFSDQLSWAEFRDHYYQAAKDAGLPNPQITSEGISFGIGVAGEAEFEGDMRGGIKSIDDLNAAITRTAEAVDEIKSERRSALERVFLRLGIDPETIDQFKKVFGDDVEDIVNLFGAVQNEWSKTFGGSEFENFTNELTRFFELIGTVGGGVAFFTGANLVKLALLAIRGGLMAARPVFEVSGIVLGVFADQLENFIDFLINLPDENDILDFFKAITEIEPPDFSGLQDAISGAWDDAKDYLPSAETVKANIQAFVDEITAVEIPDNEAVKSQLSTYYEGLSTHVETLLESMPETSEITDFFSSLKETVGANSGLFNAASVALWATGFGTLSWGVTGLVTALGDWSTVEGIITDVEQFIDALGNQDWRGAGSEITQIGAGFGAVVAHSAGASIGSFSDFVSHVTDMVGLDASGAVDFLNSLESALTNITKDSILTGIQNLVDSDLITSLRDQFAGFTLPDLSSLVEGIGDIDELLQLEDIRETIRVEGGELKDALSETFASPEFEKAGTSIQNFINALVRFAGLGTGMIGGFIGGTVVEGIRSLDTVITIFLDILTAAAGALDEVAAAVQPIIDNLTKSLDSLTDGISEIDPEEAESAKNFLTRIGEGLARLIAAIVAVNGIALLPTLAAGLGAFTLALIAFRFAVDSIDTVIGIMADLEDFFVAISDGDWKEAGNEIIELAGGITELGTNLAAATFDTLADISQFILDLTGLEYDDSLLEDIRGIADFFKELDKEKVVSGLKSWGDAWNSLVLIVELLGTRLKTAWARLKQRFWNGVYEILSGIGSASNMLEDAFGSIGIEVDFGITDDALDYVAGKVSEADQALVDALAVDSSKTGATAERLTEEYDRIGRQYGDEMAETYVDGLIAALEEKPLGERENFNQALIGFFTSEGIEPPEGFWNQFALSAISSDGFDGAAFRDQFWELGSTYGNDAMTGYLEGVIDNIGSVPPEQQAGLVNALLDGLTQVDATIPAGFFVDVFKIDAQQPGYDFGTRYEEIGNDHGFLAAGYYAIAYRQSFVENMTDALTDEDLSPGLVPTPMNIVEQQLAETPSEVDATTEAISNLPTNTTAPLSEFQTTVNTTASSANSDIDSIGDSAGQLADDITNETSLINLDLINLSNQADQTKTDVETAFEAITQAVTNASVALPSYVQTIVNQLALITSAADAASAAINGVSAAVGAESAPPPLPIPRASGGGVVPGQVYQVAENEIGGVELFRSGNDTYLISSRYGHITPPTQSPPRGIQNTNNTMTLNFNPQISVGENAGVSYNDVYNIVRDVAKQMTSHHEPLERKLARGGV